MKYKLQKFFYCIFCIILQSCCDHLITKYCGLFVHHKSLCNNNILFYDTLRATLHEANVHNLMQLYLHFR